jgi:outer membrane protein insertion porin family
VYDVSRLDRKLYFDITSGDVSSLYMDRGHLFFDIRKEESLVGEDSIDLTIHIYEGPQAIIKSVIIKGNTKTSEHVIRRELRTLPGDYFSRANLIRSQREIAALGLFDPEQIGINPKPNPVDGTVDIEFTVVEKPSDQIELSAGWGGQVGGLFGTAGIVFNNFSLRNVAHPDRWNPLPAGDGQQLSLRVQSNGAYYQSYTFSFVEPWFGGKKPNSLGLSANYALLNRAGLPREDEKASFIITRSLGLSYGKRLKWPDEYFGLNSSLNFQNYYLHDYPGFLIRDGNANNFYIKETFQRRPTYLNPQFPEDGSSMWLSLQLTPPYSLIDPSIPDKADDEKYKWLEYHKWRFNVEWYTPLTRKKPGQTNQRRFVLKAAAKLGFVGYYNKALGLPGFELFQVGGDGLTNQAGYTLVGYDVISLRGTESAFTPVGGESDNKSGNIFNKFTLELRYPFSTSAATTIYGLVFAEGGNSYSGFKNYDPFKLRRSVGVGLRVFLPMFGMLGFDYGIGFDNPETQGLPFGELLSRGAFHFKIGFEPE